MPLLGDTDRCFGTRQQVSSNQNLFLETAFRSLRTTVRLRTTILRSTFPAYLFGTSLNLLQARSVHSFPTPAGWPRLGQDRRYRPVAWFRSNCSSPSSGFHSPSGFHPFRIEAFHPFPYWKVHCSEPPDVPSLPAADSINRLGCGSTFQDRYGSISLRNIYQLTKSAKYIVNHADLEFESRSRILHPRVRQSFARPDVTMNVSSYPEGDFGGNQLLVCSISLSPLYPYLTSDLHVSIDSDFHQTFA